MASDEKRSALDDLYAATQALTFLHHVEHHSGEGGSWWKQECCSGHHEMILKAGEELRALRAENARLRERISDLVLLWSWGAGGKAGTGFAEKLGGDGDGETWAVKFDPMDPDEGCEFVVRVETGQDGLPILDDAARAALGGRDE
jgi:hypothetical protein